MDKDTRRLLSSLFLLLTHKALVSMSVAFALHIRKENPSVLLLLFLFLFLFFFSFLLLLFSIPFGNYNHY